MPDAIANVRYKRWVFATTVIFASALDEAGFQELVLKYTGNDPKWNLELGHRLGYLQPRNRLDRRRSEHVPHAAEYALRR